MLERALMVAMLALAILGVAEAAKRYHPLALAGQTVESINCGDWSVEACKAR